MYVRNYLLLNPLVEIKEIEESRLYVDTLESINISDYKLGLYAQRRNLSTGSYQYIYRFITDKPCTIRFRNGGGGVYDIAVNTKIGDYYYNTSNIAATNTVYPPAYKFDLTPLAKVGDTTPINVSIVNEIMESEYRENPTLDLDVYTQGNYNPVITFVSGNLEKPLEDTSYYCKLWLDKKPFSDDILIGINDYPQNFLVSYNDADAIDDNIGANLIPFSYEFYHIDTSTAEEVRDGYARVVVYSDGTMNVTATDNINVSIHEDTSPYTNDEYKADDTIFVGQSDPTGGNLDNVMSNSYVIDKPNLMILDSFLWSSQYVDGCLKNNTNPIENIVSLKMIPFDLGAGTSKLISIGGVPSTVYGSVATTTHRYDIGVVDINKKYNSFLDYEPFTSVSIHLPFIGMYDLPTNLVMGKKLKITYVVDILTGSCCVELAVGNGTNYNTFDYVMGNCGVDLPITASNRTQVDINQKALRIQGTANAIQSSLGAIGNLASGNVGGVISSAVGGVANAMLNDLSLSTATYHTITKGSLGSQLCNYMTPSCYILYDRPVYKYPDNYGKEFGYPSNLTLNLSTLKGYTQLAHSVEITNIPCTEDERERLRTLLTQGFYLDWKKKMPNDVLDNNGDIVFYKNNSDKLDVSKDLQKLFTVDKVLWKEDTDAFQPSITFRKRKEFRQANYCKLKINDIDKYYFINKFILRKGGIVEIELEVDVLTTYADYIKGLYTIVTRQEEPSHSNKYIVDNMVSLPTYREVTTHTLADRVGLENPNIVLTVVG